MPPVCKMTKTNFTPKRRLSRRDFLKLMKYGLLNGLLLVTGGGVYASQIEPNWLEVTEVSLVLPRLPRSFHGFRLGQVSDLHLGGWMTPERLETALSLIPNLKLDAFTITGDLINGYELESAHSYLEAGAATLSRLSQVVPIFCVMGNHDHWADITVSRRLVALAGITELKNDVHAFERNGETLYLAGLDDMLEHFGNLTAIMEQLPLPECCAILMAHEPDTVDRVARTGRFDLQISGHTHGGQVALPFYGPLMLPSLGRKYWSGLYQVGKMYQYTNRGLGMIVFPFRFNSRPEITVFTLLSP